MKTTFTLLIIIGLSLHAYAQRTNPFNHKAGKQTVVKTDGLKNGQVSFMPTSITIDSWEEGSWQFNLSSTLEYDNHGNVLTMTNAQGKIINSYDANNNLTQNTMQVYDDGEGTYINSFKTEYSYDAQNYQFETIGYMWISGEWQISSGNKMVREYDTNGGVISEISSFYQMGMGWSESYGYKRENTYTGALLTEEIWYNRDNGVWVPEDKTEWFYDSNNKPNLAREYEHDGNDFVLMGRYIDVSWFIWNGNMEEESYPNSYTNQTYNGTGDINDAANYTNNEKMMASYPEGNGNGIPPVIIEVSQDWIGGEWVNSERGTYEQKDNYVSDKEEEWQNGEWLTTYYDKTYTTPAMAYHIQHTYVSGALINVVKDTQIFDAFGNLVEDKEEAHMGDENWMQDSGTKYDITYEGSTAKMLQRITMEWNSFTDTYVNDTRETFDYTPTNIETEKVGVSVYPTIINSEINIISQQEGLATFYSLTGSAALQKEVYTGTNNISTSTLPSGYYILKVNGHIFKVIKK